MNLLQLVQRLHRESGRSGNGPSVLTDPTKELQRLIDWIADAWREWQRRGFQQDFKFMRRRATVDLVSGTSSYTPSSLLLTGTATPLANWGQWRPETDDYSPVCYRQASPTNWWRLHWMPLDQWRETYVFSTQPNGPPMDWSVDDDGSLLIGPAPEVSTYSLRVEYLRAITELDEATDTPDLAADLHMLLVWRALVEVGKTDNAPDVLSRASANYGRVEDDALAREARTLTLGGPLA